MSKIFENLEVIQEDCWSKPILTGDKKQITLRTSVKSIGTPTSIAFILETAKTENGEWNQFYADNKRYGFAIYDDAETSSGKVEERKVSTAHKWSRIKIQAPDTNKENKFIVSLDLID